MAHSSMQTGIVAVLIGAAAELEGDCATTKPAKANTVANENFILTIAVLVQWSELVLMDNNSAVLQFT